MTIFGCKVQSGVLQDEGEKVGNYVRFEFGISIIGVSRVNEKNEVNRKLFSLSNVNESSNATQMKILKVQ